MDWIKFNGEHETSMTRLRDWHGAQADRWPDREDHADCRDYLNDYLQALEADRARSQKR